MQATPPQQHSPPHPPPLLLGIGDEEIRGLKLYSILQREMEKDGEGEGAHKHSSFQLTSAGL